MTLFRALTLRFSMCILIGYTNLLAAQSLAVCAVAAILTGPSSPPPGSVVVPAGDNTSLSPVANTTYYFATGTHTLGNNRSGHIVPADNDVFIGAPGAIIDGKNKNQFAFTQHATGVTIEYLTIQNFIGSTSKGVVNHDSGQAGQFKTTRCEPIR